MAGDVALSISEESSGGHTLQDEPLLHGEVQLDHSDLLEPHGVPQAGLEGDGALDRDRVVVHDSTDLGLQDRQIPKQGLRELFRECFGLVRHEGGHLGPGVRRELDDVLLQSHGPAPPHPWGGRAPVALGPIRSVVHVLEQCEGVAFRQDGRQYSCAPLKGEPPVGLLEEIAKAHRVCIDLSGVERRHALTTQRAQDCPYMVIHHGQSLGRVGIPKSGQGRGGGGAHFHPPDLFSPQARHA
mmetsp:Transcript_14798/g.26289  ORF Transcript_14798/g.26289 Transcript_14798/m.26289 type:complete len:241 (-) Transcript_14798:777-1499(-)